MGREKNYVTRTATADTPNRDVHDFYPTPAVAVRAILDAEPLTGDVWEPACGDGAISRELISRGHRVASTDLYDHGYGSHGVDFLTFQSDGRCCDNVVTNPPFNIAEAFVHKALSVARRKVLTLCRLSWLEGTGRYGSIYNGTTPLARIHVFSSRVHFLRSGDVNKSGGGGMVAFAWFVWEHGHSGPTELHHLPPFGKVAI